MGNDVALQSNQRRKLAFVWKDGDVVFDQRGAYPVFTTLATRKGAYRFDETGQQGTLLHTVTRDRRSTGSELVAYAADGGRQCEANPETGVQGFGAAATKERTGSWTLLFRWQSPAGEQSRTMGV